MDYQLLTDSCCDLPYRFLEEHDVKYAYLTVHVDGKEYVDDLGKTFDIDWFMEQINQGIMPSTSQINVDTFVNIFKESAQKEIPILYLAFSSGMSGSYGSAVTARELVLEEYPEAAITIVDTLAGSLGEGLLVYEAIKLKESGKSLEETAAWVEEYKMHVQSRVTVDNLKHLQRGGRLSRTSATLGTLIDIKPIIILNAEGKLVPAKNVHGRNRSIQQLASETAAEMSHPEEQTVFIAYAGDRAAAEKAKDLIESQVTVKETKIYPMGSTVSTHTGYGALAIFFFGAIRE